MAVNLHEIINDMRRWLAAADETLRQYDERQRTSKWGSHGHVEALYMAVCRCTLTRLQQSEAAMLADLDAWLAQQQLIEKYPGYAP